MSDCPIHGFAPSYIFSPDLLELQEDGSLPDVLTIEVEGGFFRFNISSRKAREYGIEGTHVPFDGTACDIMDGLQEMCGHCFEERRKTLEAQQKRDG